MRSLLGVLAMLSACGGSLEEPAQKDAGFPAADAAVAPATARLTGTVTFREGYCGYPGADCRFAPLAADVLLYPLLKKESHSPTAIGDPVAKVRSGVDGKYALAAPPGKYSLFVLFRGKLEPPVSSDDGWWTPTQLNDGSNVRDIEVDHAIH